MSAALEMIFSGLLNGNYQITSPRDPEYNCIAWAAGETDRWWWPGPDVEREYWPSQVARTTTLIAFKNTFSTLSYQECTNAELELGYEKIAIFADALGIPTHAARQLASGRWTSKLGKWEDIEHDLRDLEGEFYGTVVLVLKRPQSSM